MNMTCCSHRVRSISAIQSTAIRCTLLARLLVVPSRAAAEELQNFITRKGDQLFDGDKPLSLHLVQHPESAGDRRRLRVHQAQPLALAG